MTPLLHEEPQRLGVLELEGWLSEKFLGEGLVEIVEERADFMGEELKDNEHDEVGDELPVVYQYGLGDEVAGELRPGQVALEGEGRRGRGTRRSSHEESAGREPARSRQCECVEEGEGLQQPQTDHDHQTSARHEADGRG